MILTLTILSSVVIALLSIAHNVIHSPWTYDSDRFGVLRHGVAGVTRHGYATTVPATPRLSALQAQRSKTATKQPGRDRSRPGDVHAVAVTRVGV
jgi:hypothetical protein